MQEILPTAASAPAQVVAEPAPVVAAKPAPRMIAPPAPPAPPAPMPAPALAEDAQDARANAATARTQQESAAQWEQRSTVQERDQTLGARREAPARTQAKTAASDARMEGGLMAAPAPAPAPAAPAAPPIAEDRIPFAATASPADAAFEAVADADARLSRRQWLQRIRERRDAGEHAAARASLQRFQREHPRAHIPDDLRALLD